MCVCHGGIATPLESSYVELYNAIQPDAKFFRPVVGGHEETANADCFKPPSLAKLAHRGCLSLLRQGPFSAADLCS